MLQRILQRVLADLGGPLEMGIRHLKVVFGRDGLRVADPRTDHMQGVGLREFGFTSTAKVLPQLWPWLQAGPLDDRRSWVRRLTHMSR